MKKEYMIPEMELVEMDYENSLLCGSPGGEPCPTDEPGMTLPTTVLEKGILG